MSDRVTVFSSLEKAGFKKYESWGGYEQRWMDDEKNRVVYLYFAMNQANLTLPMGDLITLFNPQKLSPEEKVAIDWLATKVLELTPIDETEVRMLRQCVNIARGLTSPR